jgi:polysaccharide biosynthesis protein VpsJ
MPKPSATLSTVLWAELSDMTENRMGQRDEKDAVPDPASIAFEILLRAQQRGWRDFDPYDGLSGLGSILPQQAVLGRRVVTQTVMRTTPRLRWALGVSPRRDAYSLGLLLSTCTLLGAEARNRFGKDLTDGLVELQLKGVGGWGYGFPVVTRAANYGPDTPNLISTAFAALGILDHIEGAGGGPTTLQMVEKAVDWLVSSLWDEHLDGFRYHPGNHEFIYNASILGALVLARASVVLGTGHMDLAERAASRVIEALRVDGSWQYGQGSRLGWVDNHHTAFILKALLLIPDSARPARWDEALNRGLSYFVENLIEEDGTPRAGPDRRYPLDSLAAGQAIETLALATSITGDLRFLHRSETVYAWSEANLRRADGRYRFRRGRFLPWPGAYLRWGEAHIALGAARLSACRATLSR